MAYIDYLNSFNQWLESGTLPVHSQLLYFKLLNVFNRAGWPEYVQVDNLRLMIMAGVTTEKTVIRARDALIDTGFISYQKGRKGVPGKYALNKIYCNYYSISDSVSDSISDSISDSVSDSTNDSHIKTKKKTKTKNYTPPTPSQGERDAFDGMSNDLAAAVRDWLSYKQERRQGYKATGRKKLIAEVRNNAEIFGEAAVIEVINQSIASNYQGITFARLKERGRQYGNPERNTGTTKPTKKRDWGITYDVDGSAENEN